MATKKDTSVIPKGHYCYHGSRSPSDPHYKPCVYWEMKQDGEGEPYGYCNFLELGDLDFTRKIATLKKGEPITYQEITGAGLLWDQVKECDENYDSDIEDETND
jgi:hypothetical protein